jgi:hypothetical protein
LWRLASLHDPRVGSNVSPWVCRQVDKSNKRHLERLLAEGKQRILGHLTQTGASEAAVRSVAQDRFDTFQFKQF